MKDNPFAYFTNNLQQYFISESILQKIENQFQISCLNQSFIWKLFSLSITFPAFPLFTYLKVNQMNERMRKPRQKRISVDAKMRFLFHYKVEIYWTIISSEICAMKTSFDSDSGKKIYRIR